VDLPPCARPHPGDRDTLKYGKLIEFAEVLPRVRAAVEKALRRPLGRETLLAAVVRLLERTQIRIGNDEYAKQNGSFGLTTLRDRHVRVTGNVVHFKFRGKSRVKREVDLCDRRLARIIRQCLKLPGHELFHYLESDGHMRRVSSDDVNEFLSQLAGRRLTAKEFRTWTGTVLAARTLAQMSHGSAAEAKRNICAAVKTVAAQLGNTPAVCRRSYIHPAVLEAYEHDELRRAMSKIRPVSDHGAGLDADERAVRDLLVHASAPARRHAA
jgi:DNA topoisomerase-1